MLSCETVTEQIPLGSEGSVSMIAVLLFMDTLYHTPSQMQALNKKTFERKPLSIKEL